MKTPSIIVWALIAYCVFVLVTGAARADALTPPLTTGSGPDWIAPGHGSFPQALIDRLEQQGVDVTEVRTALQNGDTEAVKAWLDAYREAHPDEMKRGPGGMDPEKIIDRLEQAGVDVSEVRTALQNGDAEAVKAWLDEYRKAHPDVMARSPKGTGPQKIIGRLERQGVDVTEVKAAFENGDTDAVKAWIKSYFEAHKNDMPERHMHEQAQV